MKTFKPMFGFKNAHLQTIYSSLFRKPLNISFEKKTFILSDGDFLECYWHKSNKLHKDAPLVILFHGLAGSYKSPYMQGIVHHLDKNGFNSVIMHFRGSTGNDNNLPRSYHSGETGDALEFITSVQKEFPNSKIYAVGYSLGANMLLKLVGELKENRLLEKVVAVSPPMQLEFCSNKMSRGVSRYYQYLLIKELKVALYKKCDKHDMESLINLKHKDIKKIKTFKEFDSAYTAPIHGFQSAEDYYKKSSSKQYLKDIQTPTLIIHSQDDPFMTPQVIPKSSEISKNVTLEVTEKGGHVGFIGGTFFKPQFWLEERIVDFLK